jgi:hypothetical protein
MAKRNKETVIHITDKTIEAISKLNEGTALEITSAQIKDDFCNYSFDIIKGVGAGQNHSVKGKGLIVDQDMHTAFAKLNVHLAYIDDVFHNNKIEVGDIDTMHGHELTDRYLVTGFIVKGGEENLSVVLQGSKSVDSVMDRIELTSPKISIESTSHYKWYNELQTAIEECREEVLLYNAGKYTQVEKADDKESAGQEKIDFDNQTGGEE